MIEIYGYQVMSLEGSIIGYTGCVPATRLNYYNTPYKEATGASIL